MAVELATGYISLVPSARGFSRNLTREISGPLETAGTDAGSRTSRNFGRTFVAGMGTVGSTAAVALAGGFTLLGGLGVKIAADFEQTQIAFEGILGSKGAADKVLGELRDFAAKSPFEFTGLTDSAKTLLGVGFAAEDIIPTMSTLGDVAATLGVGETEIKGVVRALGQMKGKGKASAEELQQISEQIPGFSAINAIAEQMGITTQEAFTLMEKGAIPAETAIEAILGGMASFPGAAGAMERQSKTLNGVISTFKDTLATTAIDFITPYLPAISSAVAAFGGFISETLVPSIQSLIDIFSEEGMGGIFSRLGSFIAENAPILGQQLLDLGAQLVAWIEPRIPGLLEELAGFLGAAATWFISDGLPMLAEGVAVLVPALVDWVLTEALPDLLDALPDMLAALVEWIATEAVPAIFEGGREMGAALGEGFYEALRDAFTPSNSTMDLEIPGTGIKIPVPVLDDGGIVPGPIGSPRMVLAHGGETVFPTHKAPLSAFMPEAGPGGGSVIGELHVVQMPGEDAITTAFREARRASMLVGT